MNPSPEPSPHALFVSGERTVARAALERASLRAASGLRTLGVGPGDPVAFLLRNDFAFFEATYAARALGAYAVPLNWHLAPAEVEALLCTMPGVRDCAVFGIPDEEFGERLMAVVQPDDGDACADAEGVRRWLGERLAAFKVPRQVEFRRDLPRDDTGKIYKRRLRDPYWEGAGKRI